jgi:hypothetical protein
MYKYISLWFMFFLKAPFLGAIYKTDPGGVILVFCRGTGKESLD